MNPRIDEFRHRTEVFIDERRQLQLMNIETLGDINDLEQQMAKKAIDIREEVALNPEYSNQFKRDAATAKTLENDADYVSLKAQAKTKRMELSKGEVEEDYLRRIIRLNTAYIIASGSQ